MYHVGRDALIPPLELVQTLRQLEGKPPYARYLQILIYPDNYITDETKLQLIEGQSVCTNGDNQDRALYIINSAGNQILFK